MKKNTKLIALLTAVALLAGLAAQAAADDRIYTSPIFKIPKSRISEPLYPETPGGEENGPETEPETTDGTEPAEEGTEPETTDGTEPAEEGTEPASDPGQENLPEQGDSGNVPSAEPDEPAEPVREVRIYSSRKEEVTEGDIIELTSVLIGFDDLSVTYQWQVDRGDGEGWQDVEGANRWKYVFIASKETIMYNWRLIVTADE